MKKCDRCGTTECDEWTEYEYMMDDPMGLGSDIYSEIEVKVSICDVCEVENAFHEDGPWNYI